MFKSHRITKLSLALTLAAGLVACDDVTPPAHKVAAPVAASPPAPAEVPPPVTTPTPPPVAVTDEKVKVQPTVVDEEGDQNVEPSEALAAARKRLGERDGEGALRLAKVAVLRTPKRSGAWNVLGRAQLLAGKRKDAIASFEKAVELNPQSSYARNNLGLALIYEKRFEEAADSLEQAVELEPVEGYMWNNLGMAYEQLDWLEEARDAYDKAVAMDSDRASASLTRLKGVTSVIRTAKVDNQTKDEFGGHAEELGPVGPSAIR